MTVQLLSATSEEDTHSNVTDVTPLLILWGSQTGNAQDVAERIEREARMRHYSPRVQSMDSYAVTELPNEQNVVFVASTTGQGEVPDSMKRFWTFLLNKNLPSESLSGVGAVVFGLGDSGYLKYNVVAKKLERRLAQLGAGSIAARGLGDDQHPSGYEAALDPWLAGLWSALRKIHPLPAGILEPAADDTATDLVPKFVTSVAPHPHNSASNNSSGKGTGGQEVTSVKLRRRRQATVSIASEVAASVDSKAASLDTALCALKAAVQLDRLDAGTASGAAPASEDDARSHSPYRPAVAQLTVNRRLTAGSHSQDVRHVQLDLEPSGLTYEPGDALALFPQQPPDAIRTFLRLCQLEASDVVTVGLADHAQDPSLQVTAWDLVAGCFDICGASPRRFFFEVLHSFATNEVEKERLQYLATPEGRDDLYRYNQQEGRTVIEVLQDFKSARPPLAWLLQTVPRLRPRLFSISSSPAAHPGQAHLTAAIVSWVTPSKRRRKGVCTSWLAGLQKGAQLPVWALRGAIHLPPSPETPLILVGPGTGVAPFRAFLYHRRHLALSLPSGSAMGPVHLFFGCRSASNDYLYSQEWQQLSDEGVLTGLHVAFSRDRAQKHYVTHLIRELSEVVWLLLQQGAAVYVSGSANKMPQDVMTAFEDVVMAQGDVPRDQAKRYLRSLELGGRYHVEAWS